MPGDGVGRVGPGGLRHRQPPPLQADQPAALQRRNAGAAALYPQRNRIGGRCQRGPYFQQPLQQRRPQRRDRVQHHPVAADAVLQRRQIRTAPGADARRTAARCRPGHQRPGRRFRAVVVRHHPLRPLQPGPAGLKRGAGLGQQVDQQPVRHPDVAGPAVVGRAPVLEAGVVPAIGQVVHPVGCPQQRVRAPPTAPGRTPQPVKRRRHGRPPRACSVPAAPCPAPRRRAGAGHVRAPFA